jgi:hypothetical protein
MAITREQLQKQIDKDRKDFRALSVNVREAVVTEMTGVWVTHLWDNVISETAEARVTAAKAMAEKKLAPAKKKRA